jgi:hypothetical protein
MWQLFDMRDRSFGSFKKQIQFWDFFEVLVEAGDAAFCG